MTVVARVHYWSKDEFAHFGANYILLRVCEAARDFAIHEVMESLKIDGQHYFADTLSRDHGANV